MLGLYVEGKTQRSLLEDRFCRDDGDFKVHLPELGLSQLLAQPCRADTMMSQTEDRTPALGKTAGVG